MIAVPQSSVFSLEHLCGTDGPTYISKPRVKGNNGVAGAAGDRFWFDASDEFCMSTAYAHAEGYWQDEIRGCSTAVRDLMLNVAFSDDQTGCQPTKSWDIPKTQECKDIFYKLLDSCKWCLQTTQPFK